MTKLRLLTTETSFKNEATTFSKREIHENSTRGVWERYWKSAPQASLQDQERIQRTQQFIERVIPFKERKKWIDVGCGRGEIAAFFCKKNQHITALDAATNILKGIEGVATLQGCLPFLKLTDELYDGLICTDVIAEIDEKSHRLTVSEWARILKRGGWLVCSTPLDLYSEDALSLFLQLVSTEFNIIEMQLSFHRLFFYLNRFIGAPKKFIRASRDLEYCKKQLLKRKKIARYWFLLNTKSLVRPFWKTMYEMSRPLIYLLEKNVSFFLFLEKLSKFFWNDNAITHVVLIAKKRSLS